MFSSAAVLKPDPAASALRVQDVSVDYGLGPVIKDISFEVRPGEVFGLIGLNGAGKTSLIKCVLGLREQNAGSISVFGHSPEQTAARHYFAYLPERFEPAWFLKGMEFLKFSLKFHGKKAMDEEFLRGAESFRLDTAALKRKVQSYSKGMRQKLGLLGTVMTEAPLFILDEPMSGLDPVARSLVKDRLLKEKAQGHTIFLSSHILSDMDEICDRVAVLHDGAICFCGTPADMKKQAKAESLERAFLNLIQLS
ncbi:MAG: ABC transporter ATP-binding protein [Alphaproteobacteria bacterium]|nr:ABC transporter ATP-binding protein [Alphaproteobacteria bacterium]MCD8566571.1 ABC transporter ATP-binding protein [Alphaproteobacteria bacterium]